MSLYKRVSFLIFSFLFVSCAAYYLGCSSAESTTGKLAFQQQDYPKAVTELKKGLLVDQTDDEGWYMLGYSQIETGDFSGAETSFKKSLAISKNFADKINYYWVEKYNAGVKEFQSGIDFEGKKDSVQARSYYENALKSFQASSAIAPDSVRSISAIGETYLALGENDKALSILNDIATRSHNPTDAARVAKILFESGLGMMQNRNYTPAIGVYKKVLEIPSLPKDNPYYETTAYNLGLALAKQGEVMRNADENSNYKANFSEALTYLEPLTVSLTKKDLEPQIYELLVSVYANLGMTEKAQDALTKKNALGK